MKRKMFNKVMAASLAAAMTVGTVGCGSSATTAEAPADTTASETTETSVTETTEAAEAAETEETEEGPVALTDADGNVYLKTPDSITADFTINNYQYTYGWCSYSPLILKDELPVVDTSDPYASDAWRQGMVDAVYDMLPTETFSTKKFATPEALDERDFIEDELDTYLSNFIATSIIDGVTDDSWNAHLQQLKTVQYYEWLDWYQQYIDGEL